jgi:hypothetical protein
MPTDRVLLARGRVPALRLICVVIVLACGLLPIGGKRSTAGATAPVARSCQATDLDALTIHGAAMTQTYIIIRFSLVDPWASCVLSGRPQVQIWDAEGNLVVESATPDPADGVAVGLSAGSGASITVEWDNWCGQGGSLGAPPPIAGPLTVITVLPAAAGSVRAHPAGTQAEEGPLGGGPPCLNPDVHSMPTLVGRFTEVPGDTFGPPGEIPRYVGARFLAYWRMHGGVRILGYPISAEFDQQLEDGKTYSVQYFERARLEYHPENQAPYDVLLGQFGRHFHPADPPAAPRPDAVYFPQSGHNVRAGFWDFWQRFGDLAQFGYPLTDEFTETLDDGKPYLVQYFERARFDHHPENAPPYDVLLGQFGRRTLAETGR